MIFSAQIKQEETPMQIGQRTRYAFTLYNPYARRNYARNLYVIVWERDLATWLRLHLGRTCIFDVRLPLFESETIAAEGHFAPLGVCINVQYYGVFLYDKSWEEEPSQEIEQKELERGWHTFRRPRKLRVWRKGREVAP